jgi:hypothetical protein
VAHVHAHKNAHKHAHKHAHTQAHGRARVHTHSHALVAQSHLVLAKVVLRVGGVILHHDAVSRDLVCVKGQVWVFGWVGEGGQHTTEQHSTAHEGAQHNNM